MIYKKDPREQYLLSRYNDLLSEAALRELANGWQGIFRRTILGLLPVEHLEKNFSAETGRPTKELFSVCGLLLMMEYFGWTQATARLNYMVDLGVQYALNIEQDRLELGERTLYRYLERLREEDFAQETMSRVTEKLIEELNLDIREQRLDSTHVFSNMAVWTRRKLYHKIIWRFLKQIKRHYPAEYDQLDSEIAGRYECDNGWIFGETSPMKVSRGGKVFTAEEQLGYDMQRLIERFSGKAICLGMTSYKDLIRVFEEQFLINDGKAEMNPNPGGQVLLNPSDREAEIGHKGAGYQVQIMESCSSENPVQLITAAIPQGASRSDMASFPEALDELKRHGSLPEKLFADAGYGSDDNYILAQGNEVELVAPAPHQPKDKVGLDECEFDADSRMITCPAGRRPMFSEFKNGRGRAVFHLNACGKCPLQGQCRSSKCGKQNRDFRYKLSDLRSMARRKIEATAEFKDEYGKKRTPIEGLNGRLKQFTPLRHLRVRGGPAVFHSIRMILSMHNIMQAARYFKILGKKAIAAAFCLIFAPFSGHRRNNSLLNAA